MSKKKWIGLAVILVAAAGLVVAAVLHFRHGRIYPSTEDAYVHGDVAPIASRLQGTLTDVLVDDNDWVEAGQVIARLDPRDLDQAVAKARAELAKAQATLQLDSTRVAGARADLEVARAQARLAESDQTRYTTLQDRGSVAERQSQQARTQAEVATAQVQAAETALAAVRAELQVDREEVDRMRAALNLAQLHRSYAEITTPVAGMVADKSAQSGQTVAPGQPLCQVVQLAPGHLWVTANYKETQIGRMEVGQPARVTFDAHSGDEYQGRVEALSAGTGAAFSLLPPENATGNWVKIVQRLPVRIALDLTPEQARKLRIGLSSSVEVDTRPPEKRQ